MSFTITIDAYDPPVTVEMGQTILEAAVAQGVPYPHGCRSGNCGACKSELVTGEVEMSPYSEYALTAAEKDAGQILACRAVPWSDCTVKWIEENERKVFASRVLDCRVAEIAEATHDIRIIRLAIEAGGPFDYAPGQYAEVTFPGLPARDYSMATPPNGDVLEFHIRLVGGGAVTPFVQNELKAGDRVGVSGPLGTAHLREQHRGPILAVAGGSGLAPVNAIVEAALAEASDRPIHLYFGVRAERDLYFEDRFLALAGRHPNLNFTPVLSEPDAPTDRRTGYLADAIAEDFGGADALDGFKAYLAGPPIAVETTVEKLRAAGMRRRDIHADAFYTEAEKAKLATAERGTGT